MIFVLYLHISLFLYDICLISSYIFVSLIFYSQMLSVFNEVSEKLAHLRLSKFLTSIIMLSLMFGFNLEINVILL